MGDDTLMRMPLRIGLRVVVWAGALVLALFVCHGHVKADTSVPGAAISGPTTWTLAGSPYIVTGNVSVQSSGTLTVEAGVEVRMGAVSFTVHSGGALILQGSAGQPVRFTSGAASPAAGDWLFIHLQGGSRARLSHCVIEYAGASSHPALYVDSSDVQMRDCTLRHGKADGIHIRNVGLAPLLERVTVQSHAGRALFQNTLDMNPVYRDLHLTGNGTNAVVSNGAGLGRSVTLDGSPEALNGSPFLLLSNVGVSKNYTLTVTPGTTLKWGAVASLVVNQGGALVMEGSAGQPVRFTSGAASPAAGDWLFIHLQGDSRARLSHCVIEYAGASSHPTLYVDSSDVQMRDCTLRHGKADGIHLRNVGLAPLLERVTVQSHAGRALFQNTLDMNPVYHDLHLTGNGTNAVVSNGAGLARSVTLDGSPEALNGSPFLLLSNVGVSKNYTLTVTPGTTLKWGAVASLVVNQGGALVMEGSAGQPVRFTSGAASPAAGDWLFIHLQGGSRARLSHCTLEYAGASSHPALYVDSSDVQMRYSRVRSNVADGVRVRNNAQPGLRFNEITDNGFGLRNDSPATPVDGRAIWWGDPSGPYHATTNPGGKGNAVSDGVIFQPWFASPAVDMPLISPTHAGNTGSVSIAVFTPQAILAPGVQIKITKSGQTDIALSGVKTNARHDEAVGTLTLAQAELGLWNVAITPPGVATIVVPEVFTVEEVVPPDVKVDVLGWDAIRANAPAIYTLAASNRGNVDGIGPIVWVTGLPPGAQLSVDPILAGPGSGAAASVSPVIPLADQKALNLWFPIIPSGTTVTGRFTVTAPSGGEFEMAVHVLAPDDYAADTPLTSAEADSELAPAALAIAPQDQPGIDEMVNHMKAHGNDTSWIKHGLTYPTTGKSCGTAADQRADEFRALRNQQNSVLTDWKIGTIYYGSHYVNVVQSPHTGTFYYADSYVHAPVVGTLTHNNPNEKEPSLWTFKPSSTNNKALNALYKHDYKSATMKEWKTGIPAPQGAKGCPVPKQKQTKKVNVVQSRDPNMKTGPIGFGAQHALTGLDRVTYAVYFENQPSATVAAQHVVITDRLDPALFDLDGFQVGPITVGSYAPLIPPAGASDYEAVLDLGAAAGVKVRVQVYLERMTGEVTCHFWTLDRATGELTQDPLAGFLPPNQNAPQGEGSLLFSVPLKAGLASGTVLRNRAQIVFDANEALQTNEWQNVIDRDAPVSRVNALPAAHVGVFTVTWSGTDAGMGVARYTIYASRDGGPFAPWLTNVEMTSALFAPPAPGAYAFYSRARDGAGNLEANKTAGEAATVVTPPTETVCLPALFVLPLPGAHSSYSQARDGAGSLETNEAAQGAVVVGAPPTATLCLPAIMR